MSPLKKLNLTRSNSNNFKSLIRNSVFTVLDITVLMIFQIPLYAIATAVLLFLAQGVLFLTGISSIEIGNKIASGFENICSLPIARDYVCNIGEGGLYESSFGIQLLALVVMVKILERVAYKLFSIKTRMTYGEFSRSWRYLVTIVVGMPVIVIGSIYYAIDTSSLVPITFLPLFLLIGLMVARVLMGAELLTLAVFESVFDKSLRSADRDVAATPNSYRLTPGIKHYMSYYKNTKFIKKKLCL